MFDLSKEEVAKLAKISGLYISSDEADQLVQDLRALLSYSQQIVELEINIESEAKKNVNVFREDKTYAQDVVDTQNVFARKIDDYLVVPKILD